MNLLFERKPIKRQRIIRWTYARAGLTNAYPTVDSSLRFVAETFDVIWNDNVKAGTGCQNEPRLFCLSLMEVVARSTPTGNAISGDWKAREGSHDQRKKKKAGHRYTKSLLDREVRSRLRAAVAAVFPRARVSNLLHQSNAAPRGQTSAAPS